MNIQYAGLKEINGPLVCLEGVKDVAYDEIASIILEDGSKRLGRVVEMAGDKVILQVFEGTSGLSLENTKTVFKGKPLEFPLSTEILGRVFNGAGRPVDGLGDVFAFELDERMDGSRVQTVSLDAQTLEVTCTEREVRPLPEGGGFFENEWKRYREDGNVY